MISGCWIVAHLLPFKPDVHLLWHACALDMIRTEMMIEIILNSKFLITSAAFNNRDKI